MDYRTYYGGYDDSYRVRNRSNRYRKSKKKRRQKMAKRLAWISLELVVLVALITVSCNVVFKDHIREWFHKDPVEVAKETEIPAWIDVQIIDEGNPSRSGAMLDGINNIVIHYVGNPGTTAQQNRDFYNKEDSDVCSHFVVGIDGEVIQCVPLYERSAASNDRNHDTISIEVCHPDDSGEFTEESYQSLIKLVDWLLDDFDLSPEDVIRHYDVTGKECPRYYVRNPEAWEEFIADI